MQDAGGLSSPARHPQSSFHIRAFQVLDSCGEEEKDEEKTADVEKRGLAGEHVPAHRVVNSRGVLSGAAYFETFDLQKMLLQEEGVAVEWTPSGWSVDLKQYGWRNTMEEAQMLQEEFERILRE